MSSESRTEGRWRRWPRPLAGLMGAYVLATASGGLAILAVLHDLETFGVGFLVPVWVLPSVALYLLLEAFRPTRPWKALGYAVPAFGILAFLGVGMFEDWVCHSKEGSGLPLILALTYAPAAAVGYGFLAWSGRRPPAPRIPRTVR
jgi:hypothetical protein